MALIKCEDCNGEMSARAPACPHCGAPVAVSLSSEHIYHLQRIQLLEEIKTDLFKWLTGRFWIAGIIGIFGLNALITVTVYGLLKDDLRIATRAAALAEDATRDAKTTMAQSTGFVDKLQSQADSVNRRFELVIAKLNAESTHSRQEALSEIEILTSRLKGLEMFTSEAVAESQEAQDAFRSYQVSRVELNVAATERRSNFEENAKFEMNVLASDNDRNLAEDLVAVLSKEGFRASILQWNSFDEVTEDRMIDYGANAKEAAIRARDLIAPLLDGEKLPVRPVHDSLKYSDNYFSVILNPVEKGS